MARRTQPCPPLPPGFRVLRVGETFRAKTDMYSPPFGKDWVTFASADFTTLVVSDQEWTCTPVPDPSKYPRENDDGL